MLCNFGPKVNSYKEALFQFGAIVFEYFLKIVLNSSKPVGNLRCYPHTRPHPGKPWSLQSGPPDLPTACAAPR